MRANLARHGRRLLVCQARTAPSCAAYATPARRRPTVPRPIACPNFERTFLSGLFQKPPRQVRQPEYEPGWLQIMVWRSRILDNVRPQPRKELVEAWKKLMQSKLNTRMPFNSTQALQCRRLLEYLSEPSKADQQIKSLSSNDLSMARQVLLQTDPIERTQHHLDFAKSLHSVWSSANFPRKSDTVVLQWTYLIKAMCLYGGSREALQMLYEKWEQPEYAIYLTQEDRLLQVVAKGLAREGCESELVELVEYAENHKVPYDARIQAIMVDFFAQQDRVAETKHWLNKPLGRGNIQAQVYRTLASFAMRNNLQEWATSLFLELGESQPWQKYWNVLLQAILITGKSLAEVDAMMSHMVDGNGGLSPDIHTFNGLLRVAAEQRNAALGEDILALAANRGIAPNGETHLILLDLQLGTDNLMGAREAYNQVRHIQPWTNETKPHLYSEFRTIVNDYLVALAAQKQPDFKFISSVLESVEEDQMRLEPTTVAALCLRFLENDQHFDVMDILSIYSFLYSESEREVVQQAFISFCLDPSTSTNRAWGAYQLLHQFFQDTSFERRVELMNAFFNRKRPDMASHIFGHMRAHRNKSYHPKMDTYITCLEGFARYPDHDGLEMVHNMLKMDTSLQPSTKLYTALMMAYTGCGQPLIALDYWNQITQSREGPSYATLEAIFWTLEKKTGGHKQAREIWERIERMDLEVPPRVYNAYIGAIAGNGNEKEVRGLILKMASVVGSEPDAMTLGIAYNALAGQQLQQGFQEWAKGRYHDIWTELMKVGRRMDEYSLCQFKIERAMKA
ncbi:complex i intermediate-associated 84 [Trichoderma arundinaceum]|uniref:Complex i intermediate-associated 84 n=1 Tax=Trichoderma arundinaceum TaxID=490622 RepID=A0A395NQR4_TRIAR|nr:complex i intermediate-associated 84 [Trichoderma arundinaceum]